MDNHQIIEVSIPLGTPPQYIQIPFPSHPVSQYTLKLNYEPITKDNFRNFMDFEFDKYVFKWYHGGCDKGREHKWLKNKSLWYINNNNQLVIGEEGSPIHLFELPLPINEKVKAIKVTKNSTISRPTREIKIELKKY